LLWSRSGRAGLRIFLKEQELENNRAKRLGTEQQLRKRQGN
jgi:hypothetical protein